MIEEKTLSASARHRAESRASKDAWQHERYVKTTGDRVAALAARLWPAPGADLCRLMHAAIDEWYREHQPRPATRLQVALHEAGHFIAFETENLVAAKADIRGSNFGRGGWNGSASQWRGPIWEGEPKLSNYTAEDVQAEAVSVLAGPVAETVLAEGDFYSSSGEIIQLCLLAARLAEMQGIKRKQALINLLVRTARLVDGHRTIIEAISTKLERRRRIFCFNKDIAKLLKRAPSGSLDRLPEPAPDRIEQLVRLIADAPINLAALIKRVVP